MLIYYRFILQVMEYIGKFGKYQRRVFFWLWLLAAAGGLAVVVFSFTGLDITFT